MAPRKPGMQWWGLTRDLLEYLERLPGDYGRILIRLVRCAEWEKPLVTAEGYRIDFGEVLVSTRSERLWGGLRFDREVKRDGQRTLIRRALHRFERDGWIEIRAALPHGPGAGPRRGPPPNTGSGPPPRIVRFLRHREIVWPNILGAAHPPIPDPALLAAQVPALPSGPILPVAAYLPPEPGQLPPTPSASEKASSQPADAAGADTARKRRNGSTNGSLALQVSAETAAGKALFEHYAVLGELDPDGYCRALAGMFPSADIAHGIKKSADWLRLNPTRRPRGKRGATQFLQNWLRKDHNDSIKGEAGTRRTAPRPRVLTADVACEQCKHRGEYVPTGSGRYGYRCSEWPESTHEPDDHCDRFSRKQAP